MKNKQKKIGTYPFSEELIFHLNSLIKLGVNLRIYPRGKGSHGIAWNSYIHWNSFEMAMSKRVPNYVREEPEKIAVYFIENSRNESK